MLESISSCGLDQQSLVVKTARQHRNVFHLRAHVADIVALHMQFFPGRLGRVSCGLRGRTGVRSGSVD